MQNGVWYYFGHDGLGSVRHLTDPYGVPLQANTASSLGFTGELTDPNAAATCL